MKIKVVYEKKIHKLPPTLSDYKTIRKAIKDIYGECLDDNFDIYTKVHPSKFIKVYNQDMIIFLLKMKIILKILKCIMEVFH